MPICVTCDNRVFNNKEALAQHLQSSSTPHPFCPLCNKRFTSDGAFESHNNAKHPPTFDCTSCHRSYHAQFALEDHYRGSHMHPNCSKCGRGFKDSLAVEEHHRTSHPMSPCGPCGGRIIYDDLLPQHYTDSANHPKCSICLQGFRDDITLDEHRQSGHLDALCIACEIQYKTAEELSAHFFAYSAHPKCNECQVGFKDAQGLDEHMAESHPRPENEQPQDQGTSVTAPTAAESSAIQQPGDGIATKLEFPPGIPNPPVLRRSESSLTSTGFTPLSPTHRFHDLIVGDRRFTNSPDIILDRVYMTPIKDTQPLMSPSATPLPQPANHIEQIWSSKDNVQVRSGRLSLGNSTPTSTPFSRPLSGTFPYLSTPDLSRPSLRTSAYGSISSPPRSVNNGYTSTPSEALLRRDRSATSVTSYVTPMSEFNPRLYPGSVRSGRGANIATTSTSSLRSSSVASSPNSRSIATQSEYGGWERYRERTSITTTGFASSLVGRTRGYSKDSPLQSSPPASSLAYSPISAVLEPEARPTTSMSARNYAFTAPTFKITASSSTDLASRSPEVSSPGHLAALPALSPMATTPIELDIPEASKPLPPSPPNVPSSPETVVLQPTDTDFDFGMGLGSPFKETSRPLPQKSDMTCVSLDLSGLHTDHSLIQHESSPFAKLDQDKSISPLSIISSDLENFKTSPQDPVEDSLHSAQTVNVGGSEVDDVTTPLTSTGTGVETVTEVSPDVTKAMSPLHCRVCLADSCDDITASMCGHIFCNRCITQAVIKTNRCPVCSTPTLLYCLFRLDLAA